MKKSERWHAYWLSLALIAFCLVACESNESVEDVLDKSKVTAPPYDPSTPVAITDFLPKEGSMGQRLVIYGKNFGNDPDLVDVRIGGKKAIVVSVNGESLYCIVPKHSFEGTIEITVGEEGNIQHSTAENKFEYERKMVSTTVAGYRNERDDQGWRNGKFKSSDISKMASGFGGEYGWLTYDPVETHKLWVVYDHRSHLYLINFADSMVTQHRSGLGGRPRALAFSKDGEYLLVAEDQGSTTEPNVRRMSRARDFTDLETVTTYKQCNTVAVHPVTGQMYYNSFSKGEVFRYDLEKYFELGGKFGTPAQEKELFLIHDQNWEFRIIIHPTGNYAYIVVVNQHYILRMDYNWSEQRFNQPYIVCGAIGQKAWVDGVGTSARLNEPYQGVFVKNEEYVAENKPDHYDFYIADIHNHAIRKLTPEGALTTFAGRGSSSLNADPWGYVNGDLREETRFDRPTGIAYNEEEKAFYIIDSSNKRLRKIALEEQEEAE